MKTKIIIIATILLACMLLFSLAACNKQETPEKQETQETPEISKTPEVSDLPIRHEMEFGGVYIEITIDDFNDLGFEFGDSVDITFTNGYTLEDIPYYNGYYVDAGETLLIGYPGYDYIKAAVNYGDDLWDTAMLQAAPKLDLWQVSAVEEHDRASVKLHEKGKYADIQKARDISYEDERSKFPSDEVFANFRGIRMGSIKEGKVFRSASPCDNQHNRAPYVDDLIEAAGVNCILDLADNENKIEGYISADDFDSPYFLSLYNEGKVIPLALNMNYFSGEFQSKIAKGFIAMSQMEGPYLIHCTEGKDRTGFVCMLIEALAGASYDEIMEDYMITYANYYKITEELDPERYQIILEKNLVGMIKSIVGDESVDITTADLSPYAKAYLMDGGMSEEQIEAFLNRLSE